MTKILAERAAGKRGAGEARIREADALAAQSSNERMWAKSAGRFAIATTAAVTEAAGHRWLRPHPMVQNGPQRSNAGTLASVAGHITRSTPLIYVNM
ncbi:MULTISPECIES: hypothetical protein [Bradyrhizobium]|uniref:hypothetical protein n=1 Tax=Bradyrhizobium elkanii TaxID=29448 RepID=UPI000418391C|nr:hypothetical protein [Bradyrhizobium elkanii]